MLKRTKIVATISDKTCTVAFLKKLHKAGVNVIRLNTAHLTLEEAKKMLTMVREVSEKLAVLIDTKGPEVRTVAMDDPIHVRDGDQIIISGEEKKGVDLFVNYSSFVKDVSQGDTVLIDDGDVALIVEKKQRGKLICRVLNTGLIKGRKSVNVPRATLQLPALNAKDKTFIRFAAQQGVTFIAHSFVRSKEDVLAIQKILNRYKAPTKIIAKIENRQGVDNVDSILDHAYGVMVARGDLGVEIPAEQLPGIQKELIKKCVTRNRPVIVATQMLHSMIEHPRPTRAEASDVANAIYDGADAVMLSGETAYGKYPTESVKTMARIAMEVEKRRVLPQPLPPVHQSHEIVSFLAHSAQNASRDLGTKAIVADTNSGRTARYLAAFRGTNIIFAQCYKKHVMRELSLSYGVYADYMEPRKTTEGFVHKVLPMLLKRKVFTKKDLIAVVAGSFGDSHGASFVEVSTVENMLGGAGHL